MTEHEERDGEQRVALIITALGDVIDHIDHLHPGLPAAKIEEMARAFTLAALRSFSVARGPTLGRAALLRAASDVGRP